MGRIITLDQIRRAKIRLLENPPQMGARIEGGYMHWQVGRYVEPLFRVGPGGVGRKRVWRVEQEAEQHNLILNQCYDLLIAQYGIIPLNQYAVVGTGSTAPDPAQTGLVNEVARTSTVPRGETDSAIYVSPGVHDIRRVKEFTEAQVGGKNLTEWGFSPASAVGGNLICRELFRDGSGNPVVLTLDTDQRLQIIYTLRVTLTPAVAPVAVTVNIANVGTRTGQFIMTGRLTTSGASINYGGIYFIDSSTRGDLIVTSLFAAGATLGPAPGLVAGSSAAPLTYSHTISDYNPISSPPTHKALTFQPASGRSRSANALILNTEWNGALRSFILTGGINNPSATPSTINLVLDAGQEFTKDNQHKLLVGDWVLTWGP